MLTSTVCIPAHAFNHVKFKKVVGETSSETKGAFFSGLFLRVVALGKSFVCAKIKL